MKFKNIIVFSLFLLGGWLLMRFVIGGMDDELVIKYFILIPALIFGFNFLIRKNIRFKPYFTSKYNFLTSKYEASISSDLSKELMFQKMVEVIEESRLKLVQADDSTLEILGIKGTTWSSWGENIYIDFTEENGVTHMNFVSTTVIGMVSWGKNEKNYNSLLSNFEESLTI